jgi:hypothetical protein
VADYGVANTTASQNGVIAGLDPAIHHPAKEMDPRVKPAGDAEKCIITGFLNFVTQ